jgi:hypothetical protein
MAWNPSPEVAVARDYGKKFDYNKVYIIAINETTGKFEVVSYGATKRECDEAKKCADIIFEKIRSGNIVIST